MRSKLVERCAFRFHIPHYVGLKTAMFSSSRLIEIIREKRRAYIQVYLDPNLWSVDEGGEVLADNDSTRISSSLPFSLMCHTAKSLPKRTRSWHTLGLTHGRDGFSNDGSASDSGSGSGSGGGGSG